MPIVKQKLTKYSQFHTNAKVTSELQKAGVPVSGFDGSAEFWSDSIEDAMAVFHDAEYLRVVVPDEMTFLDREKAVMMVGHEELKWVKPS